MSITDLTAAYRPAAATVHLLSATRPAGRRDLPGTFARSADGYRGERGAVTKTIAVIDRSAAIRAGVPHLLRSFGFVGDFNAVGAFLTQPPAVDLVLLEISGTSDGRPGNSGPDAVRALVKAGYRVCVYTYETRNTVLARCLTAGASGIIAKSDEVKVLLDALTRIAGGGTAISPSLTGALGIRDYLPLLSKRQLQILEGRARGETFHAIGRRLGISERTAQDHWSAIARRFESFLKEHSAADLERALGLDSGAAPLGRDDLR